MSDFLGNLSGRDKEDLKTVLDHPGMKVFEQWLLGHIAYAPLRAHREAKNYEEVMYYRGMTDGLSKVNNFVDETRAKLRNYQTEE